ncbi:MAG: VCBS repeat-containing protein [Candidatus Omnitrophica bacterium]|nr:VCBS repeat-containing protein [Candidatus Omnitrophota bacterium]
MEGYAPRVFNGILLASLLFLSSPAISQDTLFGDENILAGGFTAVEPVAVHAADLDGDSDLDILVSQFYSNFLGAQVMWLENDGQDDPFFTPHIIDDNEPSGESGIAIDVDKDGDLDAVVVIAGQINWYENDGGLPPVFAKRVLSSVPGRAKSLDLVDFDKDGDDDFVSVGSGVYWYENIDGGTVTEHLISPLSGVDLHCVDIDRDGDLDVSVIGTATWWLENDGSFSFTQHVAFNSGGLSVQCGDFNGDMEVDIAIGNPDNTFWIANAGNETFANQFIFGFGSNNLQAIDLNEDGAMDLLAAGEGREADSSWYRNDGTGNFSRQYLNSGGDYPRGIFGTDLDGDGDLDVISTRSGFCHGQGCQAGEITWEESSGGSSPTFAPHTITTSLLRLNETIGVDIEGDGDGDVVTAESGRLYLHKNNGSKPPGFRPIYISSRTGGQPFFPADLNNDSNVDLVTSDGFNVRWFVNFGTDVFTDRFIGNAAGFASDMEVAAALIDSDTNLDVLAGGSGLTWFQNGGGAFPSFNRVVLDSVQATSLAPGDLDGDNDTDIATVTADLDRVSLFQNSGNGSFSKLIVSSPTIDGPKQVGSADLDDDGDTDLFSASDRDGKVVWYENDGNTPPSFTLHTELSSPSAGVVSVDAGDFDGDGRLDLVSASRDTDRITWFQNDGATPPGFTDRNLDTNLDGPASVHAADVDNDGKTDILVAAEKSNSIFLLKNLGGTVPVFQQTLIDNQASKTYSVSSGDINGDGHLDILSTAEVSDTVAWYENSGTVPATFTKRIISSAVNGAHALDAADFDGDGDLDVVSTSKFDGFVYWHENLGGSPPSFQDHAVTSSVRTPLSVHAMDIDGDGDIDLTSASEADHKIAWYENDGANPPTFIAHVVSTAAEDAQWVHADDVDGDGSIDLLSATYGDDGISWYENSGSESFTEHEIVFNYINNPRKVRVADMDGDNDTDMVVMTPRKVVLLQNDGNPVPSFNASVIADALELAPTEAGLSFHLVYPWSRLRLGDVNKDGHVDVFVPGYSEISGIYWFENNGDPNPGFTTRVIDTKTDYANALDLVDLDGDDDLDLVWATSENPDRVAWRENYYGMVPTPSFTPTPTNTYTPSNTPTFTETPTNTSTNPPTLTDTPTFTQTPTPTPTVTNTPTEVVYNKSDLNLDRHVNTFDLFILALDWHRVAEKEIGNFLLKIETEEDLESITVEGSGRFDVVREGKYWAPATDDPDLLPNMFQNVNLYPFHPEFFTSVFPERFAGQDTLALILRDSPRDYFAGAIFEFRTVDGGTVYGFDSVADYLDTSELLTQEEVAQLYDILSQNFQLRPFAYAPVHPLAVEVASNWEDASFPVYLPGATIEKTYEALTVGTNYGRVRLLTVPELAEANANGTISWQDILVLDVTPFDIEGVQAAVITGSPQGELSHVALRTARRGTPNAFIANPHEVFAPYENQLIRLTLDENEYSIDPNVTLQQAQAWWDENRPSVPNPLPPNLEYTEFDNVLDMNISDSSDLVGKFGGKVAGLARMYSFLPAENQIPAFGIPFHYYHEFMTANTLTIREGEDFVTVTFQEYLESLLEDPVFQGDPEYRASRLEGFRNIIENRSVVDPNLVTALISRIEQVYGSTSTMVRFRSSSNSEDALIFNGAGLYDSTSVCPEDTLDGDELGPSHCFSGQDDERTIERALRKVWASLWNFRAFEEREYYQIPQDEAAMAILVSLAFPDEASNGVAFTGDPIAGSDAGYVINVQIGDFSTVQPDPGILPELDILKVENGQVTEINRSRQSTLLPEGEFVLSDEQLHRLGATMAIVDASMPIDLEGHTRDEVLFDMEFKFTQSGDMIFKQIRPFLRSNFQPVIPKLNNIRSDIDQNGLVDSRDLHLFLGDRGDVLEEETDFK